MTDAINGPLDHPWYPGCGAVGYKQGTLSIDDSPAAESDAEPVDMVEALAKVIDGSLLRLTDRIQFPWLHRLFWIPWVRRASHRRWPYGSSDLGDDRYD